MKRATFITGVGLLAMLALSILVQAQTPAAGGARNAPETTSAAPALLRELSDEVKRLTNEVHKLQLELQGWKIRQIETELLEAQGEQQRLNAQDEELSQEIAVLVQQLSNSALPAEERQALETAKREMVDRQMGKLRESQQAAGARNADVSQRLEQERRRWQELAAKAKPEKLTADAGHQP